MPESVVLGAALLCSLVGVAWLALAMDAHWIQAGGARRRPTWATPLAFRAWGSVALAASLLLCLKADHASIAVLVWIMSLAGAASIVALVFAWRPGWFGWMVGKDRGD